jgi:hypothetical protein
LAVTPPAKVRPSATQQTQTAPPVSRAGCLQACINKCKDDASCERSCAGRCPH